MGQPTRMGTPMSDTPSTLPDPQPGTAPTPPVQDVGTDWKAEHDRLQADVKRNEERHRKNASAAKDLETLRQSTMTELEKAVTAARNEGRTEAQKESSGRLVAAEVRVALAGRPIDAAALLEGIDATRFLTDNGDIDSKAINAWVERIAPLPEPTPNPNANPFLTVDLGQGVRGRLNEPLDSDPLIRDLKSKLGI